MPNSNLIKKLFHLQDPQLTIQNCHSEIREKQEYTILEGHLSLEKNCCSCGGPLIGWGTTLTDCLLLTTAGYPTILRLKRQRKRCTRCHKTQVASSSLISKSCSVSHAVSQKIYQLLKKKISMTDIASLLFISVNTVQRVLASFRFHTPKVLPEALSFDEIHFRKGQMTFVIADAKSHDLIDLVENRQLETLTQYFYKIPLKVRQAVKFITIDMYKPYLTLIRKLFPQAKIIIDRFHLVQLLNRAFNKSRIQCMKLFKTDSPEYRHLKTFWKLLQMDAQKLSTASRYRLSYRCHISNFEIVQQLLTYDEHLKEAYTFYQNCLYLIQTRRANRLFSYLTANVPQLNEIFQTAVHSLFSFEKYIRNSLTYRYNNGGIEGLNNQLKVIKRLEFGFGNFKQFRNRAFLILKK
jgi:transposase